MPKPKRIYIISDIKQKLMKMFVDQVPKLAKGFIRLGHDVRIFSYSGALAEASQLKSKTFSRLLYKPKVDKLLAGQIKSYNIYKFPEGSRCRINQVHEKRGFGCGLYRW